MGTYEEQREAYFSSPNTNEMYVRFTVTAKHPLDLRRELLGRMYRLLGEDADMLGQMTWAAEPTGDAYILDVIEGDDVPVRYTWEQEFRVKIYMLKTGLNQKLPESDKLHWDKP